MVPSENLALDSNQPICVCSLTARLCMFTISSSQWDVSALVPCIKPIAIPVRPKWARVPGHMQIYFVD